VPLSLPLALALALLLLLLLLPSSTAAGKDVNASTCGVTVTCSASGCKER
jgi:hypothetical protein